MIVQVILGQVGEDRNVVRHSPHPPLGQRVRRHLHHRLGRAHANAFRNTSSMSRDSGVVCGARRASSPRGSRSFRSAPSCDRRAFSIASSRNAVVVLPLVPVTALNANCLSGCPKQFAAIAAIARRPPPAPRQLRMRRAQLFRKGRGGVGDDRGRALCNRRADDSGCHRWCSPCMATNASHGPPAASRTQPRRSAGVGACALDHSDLFELRQSPLIKLILSSPRSVRDRAVAGSIG